jgi:hypothetical protein
MCKVSIGDESMAKKTIQIDMRDSDQVREQIYSLGSATQQVHEYERLLNIVVEEFNPFHLLLCPPSPRMPANSIRTEETKKLVYTDFRGHEHLLKVNAKRK